MSWYAFRVAPQKEFATVDVLRRRGVNATVPFEVKFLRRHGSQKKKLEKAYPLLVGYVLADLPGPHSIYGVMNLSYLIKSVVGFNGMPAVLNEFQVDRMLKQSGQQIANRQSVNTRKSLAKGDDATLNGHGFASYPVRVEEIRGEKAMVLVEMFGTSRLVAVRLDTLAAA
jgi:transcription antitermination factor NusG